MSTTRRYPNASLSYVARARARRAEALDVAERGACEAAGRCGCGLPATHGTECKACHDSHKHAVKGAFDGLGL